VPLTGGIIVTGPQAVSVADAHARGDAFERLEVPIIGVVENMSGDVFGSGGGQEAAKRLRVDFLARIPLDSRVRAGGDSGDPIVIAAPESETARISHLCPRRRRQDQRHEHIAGAAAQDRITRSASVRCGAQRIVHSCVGHAPIGRVSHPTNDRKRRVYTPLSVHKGGGRNTVSKP
jgi:hypothetical protein